MNKYNNGKIYTVRFQDDVNLVYVGSTIQPLYKRWHQHKIKSSCDSAKEFNKILYVKIREFGYEKFYIELYENCPCNNIEELLKREGEVIREIGTLNKVIPGRTQQMWEEDNIEERKEYFKEYQ